MATTQRPWQFWLLFPLLLIMTKYSYALESLADADMRDITGQSLFTANYINGTGTAATGTAGVDFYRMGLDAQMDININVRSLKLGCGGINGAGCDIDIDNMSLSGNSATRNGRVGSDATLTRPFIEFAIKSPNTLASREVAGFRFSAEQLVGMLTTGLDNGTTANGINTISGFMQVQSGIGATVAEQSKVKGFANTAAAYYDAGVNPINGRMVALGLANVTFVTTGGGFFIPAMNNLPFETPTVVVNQRRISALPITAQITVPPIELRESFSPTTGQVNPAAPATTTSVITQGGPVDAKVTSCTNTVFLIPACIAAPNGRTFSGALMSGVVQGAKANVTISEALGFIHSIPINSPFSLSLQKQDLLWPGSNASDIAKRGWWMSFKDPVNLGAVNPTLPINITPLFPSFASAVGTYLNSNPATTSDLAGIFTGSGLSVGIGTINLSSAAPLSLNVSNLQLNGQAFAPNCYGTLVFC